MNQMTQQEREDIRIDNAIAMKAVTHEGANVTRDLHALEHQTEALVKHDVTNFAKLMDGEFGLNMKGRVLYNLNFIAQRLCREALRDAMSAANDPVSDALSGMLSEEELSEMFGFESKPTYTLDKTLHWAMITYIAAHDVSQYTESDRYGMKSRPFAWINELIRHPYGMLAHDQQFSIKSAVDSQAVQMEKFGYREGAAASLEKFKAAQAIRAEENTKAKVELIKQTMPSMTYYKNIGTDELINDISEMLADLGINIPVLMREIADKYKEGLVTKANEGKYLGEVDEQVLEFCTPVTKETKETKRVEPVEPIKVEEAKPARQMRRIKRDETTH